jgi:hypothetical protein
MALKLPAEHANSGPAAEHREVRGMEPPGLLYSVHGGLDRTSDIRSNTLT